MTSRLFVLLIALPALFFMGCASTNGPTVGEGDPTTVDDNSAEQAKLVEDGLAQTSEMKGKYTVIPGPQFTTVVFSQPTVPEEPEALRQSMRDMRGYIAFKTGKNANPLRFVFPGMTLEE